MENFHNPAGFSADGKVENLVSPADSVAEGSVGFFVPTGFVAGSSVENCFSPAGFTADGNVASLAQQASLPMAA
jgi:hypothetical protein